MKLLHSNRSPRAGKDVLITLLISKSTVSRAQQYIDSHYDGAIKLGKDAGDARSQSWHYADDLRLLVIGMGDTPSSEDFRRAVCTCVNQSNDAKLKKLALVPLAEKGGEEDILTAIAEAALLSNYQFLIYKTDPKRNSLSECIIVSGTRGAADAVRRGSIIGHATCTARDMVNEPVITLTATELGRRVELLGAEYGFRTEVLNKSRIQALKMGGLLAVNAGSTEPPTFIIMEWKPKNARNRQPLVLVGKGVVFDTGGLSLKETAGSMDSMKCDMAGGAAVIGAMMGAAALNLPCHLIGLVPATDNRPGENAVTPGDVIRMFDGTTVEILNTDAEGRLILADALGYAKKYKPSLVIDLATLTGAQVTAVGHQAAAMMGTADSLTRDTLRKAGENTWERVVEFPLWEEYGDQLRSDIADLKNIGGKTAGVITPGKFLEHFTDYPWIHLDIAGPAWLTTSDSYRLRNGTGWGVRLLIDFIDGYK